MLAVLAVLSPALAPSSLELALDGERELGELELDPPPPDVAPPRHRRQFSTPPAPLPSTPTDGSRPDHRRRFSTRRRRPFSTRHRRPILTRHRRLICDRHRRLISTRLPSWHRFSTWHRRRRG